MKIQRILCIGAGYVGGTTMTVFAEHLPHVQIRVVDTNAERIAEWNSPRAPVYEDGLQEILERRRGQNLFFELATPEVYRDAELIFISVNTPTKTHGEGAGRAADLCHWEHCAREIGRYASRQVIIVEKSTVPVRTAAAVAQILYAVDRDNEFEVLSNPEFLAEGTAVKDLQTPDRVLIGHAQTPRGRAAAEALAALYAHWVPKERIIFNDLWSSELAKLAANAMLAQRISSINAFSALCERTGAQIHHIARAIGSDSRIGPRFLEAGLGFGGSCFRKDLLNLIYILENEALHEAAAYWQSVLRINDLQLHRFVRSIVQELFGTLAGKRIAVFGFAFKPGTNDTRDSPAITLCRRLLEEQAQLAITDPHALENARKDLQDVPAEAVEYLDDPYAAARGAHAIVLATHWPEYETLDFQRLYSEMKKPAFFFDGRCRMDVETLFRIGFQVHAIGTPPRTHLPQP